MSGEKFNLSRHGVKHEVELELRRTTFPTSDEGSVGPRYQGKEVGGDFPEISDSGSSGFGGMGFKGSH